MTEEQKKIYESKRIFLCETYIVIQNYGYEDIVEYLSSNEFREKLHSCFGELSDDDFEHLNLPPRIEEFYREYKNVINGFKPKM